MIFFYKSLLVITFILIQFNILNSQSLYFCNKKPENCWCKDGTVYYISYNDGSYLYFFLTKYPYYASSYCYEVYFDIYKEDSYGNWDYVERISADFDTRIKYDECVWNKIIFYKAGYYWVKAYDCKNNFLCSGYLTLYYDY